MLINRQHVKVSRRDAFLVAFGLTYILLGYSYLNIPSSAKPILHASLRFALDLAPIEFYGWAWIVTGVVAVIGGIAHGLDWLGFGVAVFMPFAWALAYFVAQFQDGVPRSWVGGTLFCLLAVAVSIVAGMPDPRDRGRPAQHRWWQP